MRSHHVRKGQKRYFEGWYFKHQRENCAVAFIPGLHVDAGGAASAFVQMITEKGSWFVPYPYERCSLRDDRLEIRVGDSVFSQRGIQVEIDAPGLSCRGRIAYGPLLPLKGDIMGCFALLPGMQCRHGVISLYHSLDGALEINGERMDFSGGRGYLETDRGRGFPRRYTWFHSNDFPGDRPVSLMAAVADVPLGPVSIQGVIASVFVDGREYRLATYNGGKALRCGDGEIVIRRGDACLEIAVQAGEGLPLYAPELGEMSRVIRERLSCRASVVYRRGGRVLLDEGSTRASFENCGY